MAHGIRPGDTRVGVGTVDQALEERAEMWGRGSMCQVETGPICRPVFRDLRVEVRI